MGLLHTAEPTLSASISVKREALGKKVSLPLDCVQAAEPLAAWLLPL